MALQIDVTYTNATAAGAAYPGGSFKNETSPGLLDGTPFEKQWPDDIFGFLQRLISEGGITISGISDTILASDYFDGAANIFEQSVFCSTGGSANAIVLTTASGAQKTALVDGQVIMWKSTFFNSAAVTIDLDGTGAIALTLKDGTAVPARTTAPSEWASAIFNSGSARWEVHLAQDTMWFDIDQQGTYLGFTAFPNLLTLEKDNTGVGDNVGANISTGERNVFVGSDAAGNTTGSISDNVLIGFQAGQSIISTTNSVCIGTDAGFSQASVVGNVYIGYKAGELNTLQNNTFVGYRAAEVSTSAGSNTVIGYHAAALLTIGDNNSILGTDAAASLTTGALNVIIGTLAGGDLVSGSSNVYIGASSGANHTGGDCTFVGASAGGGAASLRCTFIGNDSGGGNAAITDNTSVGNLSLSSLTSGTENTALGSGAAQGITTGDGNVFIGFQAGQSQTTLNNWLIIDNGDNAVGLNLIEGDFAANEFYLPTTNGVVVPAGIALLIDTVTGKLGTTTSSRRYKTNINVMASVQSDFIYDANIVTFNFKKREKVKEEVVWSETEHESKVKTLLI